ncbi:MAG: low specificity L-threonine aldolase [Clostridia bacterium]|nr:low specificity L-threonine aldolase [Clostridia bacterium]
MLHFESDYIAGAHPKVLEALVNTNLAYQPGYGDDAYTASAREKIRALCACPNADVVLLTGGTQTNAVVISAMLNDWQGVVAAYTGHIAAHEAGAIEFTGHKVLTLSQERGKLSAEAVEAFIHSFYADANHSHMVYPGMVYISFPTEYGTLYSKAELSALYAVCQKAGIPLFIDGARLAYGLMSPECDLTLAELASLCDVFYIGGTKAGALCGEAVVFPKGNAPAHLITSIKRRGALLAKGRLNGVQFDALFTDDLYFQIGHHAVQLAMRLKEVFRAQGVPLYIDSPTNQQFVVLEDARAEALSHAVGYSFWEKTDQTHSVLRFATSWSTTQEDIDALETLLKRI